MRGTATDQMAVAAWITSSITDDVDDDYDEERMERCVSLDYESVGTCVVLCCDSKG